MSAAPHPSRAAADPPISPGAHIEVRDAVWRVIQVDRTSSGKAAWTVVGVSEIVRDQDAIFLEEYETTLGNGVRVLDPTATRLERDRSPGHRASLLYIESLLRLVPPAGPAIHIGHRAAMDVLDFQLEPAHQALRQTRPRILIADAVGLGKTLEAGILLAELIRRGRAKRILVTTTKAMLTQFQKELWCRFAVPLVRLDTAGVQRIRDRIPTNHNPFHFYDRSIISIDTLAQNKEIRSYIERARWDVIVIDEAHNVAFRGGSRSLRSRIAQQLAGRSDALILLSATPHDGKPRSFASLMNMLDPTAIADPDRYTRADIEGLFVRRFKKDVQAQVAKSFPERCIRKVWANASAAEEAAFEFLSDLRFSSLGADRTDGGMLFKTSLEKALFSSPAACRETIRKRIVTRAANPGAAGDIATLRDLDRIVADVSPTEFSKYQRMLVLIRDTKNGFGWKPTKKNDRLVIFSESIATLHFLRDQLAADLGLRADQLALLFGGSDLDQQAIVEEFGKEKSPIRVLLASDVASEGLNLHYLSHRLIHFDVPWSLMRFAQRNGRIDRYGQERQPEIVYLLTRSKVEKIHGDARILELLADRDEQATKNIGDPSALMGVYDEEAEERITSRAIEEGLSAEEFDARLGGGALHSTKTGPSVPSPASVLASDDPMELLLSCDIPDGSRAPTPTAEPLSLFPDSFAFVEAALAWLADQEGVEHRVSSEDRIIDLALPAATEATHGARAPASDLRRRFQKLPGEVFPKDGVLLLTDDRARMQAEMAAARREDSAWPRLHFLWPLSPVTEWCADRARALFGRQAAPIVTLIDGLAPEERVVVVSGLLPNRQSQPLVHRWFAARFRGGALDKLQDFAAFVRQLDLGRRPLPNREAADLDVEPLRSLIPPAIEAVRAAMLEERARFERDINERLSAELERLETLKKRRLAHLATIRAENPAGRERHDREERGARRVFDEYLKWVEDAMTSERSPYLEVVAVFRPETDATGGGR